MHRVDSQGHLLNEWTNGDPLLGVPRTRLEAAFMNTVQRELVALPTQAGIALDVARDDQILQSVVLHVATFAALRLCPVPVTPNASPPLVYARGGAASGDGLGGFFRWQFDSALADDDFSVIRPGTNPALGRWLRTGRAPIQRKWKTADTARANDAVLSDDPHLLGYVLAPNTWYRFSGTVLATGLSADGLSFLFQFSSAPQLVGWMSWRASGGSGTSLIAVDRLPSAVIPTIPHNPNGTGIATSFRLDAQILTNAAVGGTLDLQWAQTAAGATPTTLYRGSYLELEPL